MAGPHGKLKREGSSRPAVPGLCGGVLDHAGKSSLMHVGSLANVAVRVLTCELWAAMILVWANYFKVIKKDRICLFFNVWT